MDPAQTPSDDKSLAELIFLIAEEPASERVVKHCKYYLKKPEWDYTPVNMENAGTLLEAISNAAEICICDQRTADLKILMRALVRLANDTGSYMGDDQVMISDAAIFSLSSVAAWAGFLQKICADTESEQHLIRYTFALEAMDMSTYFLMKKRAAGAVIVSGKDLCKEAGEELRPVRDSIARAREVLTEPVRFVRYEAPPSLAGGPG